MRKFLAKVGKQVFLLDNMLNNMLDHRNPICTRRKRTFERITFLFDFLAIEIHKWTLHAR